MCELRRRGRKEKPALQENTVGKLHALRERSQDKKPHLRWLCASLSRDSDSTQLCRGKGREQTSHLQPVGPGREEVSQVEQPEQHNVSRERGLKCSFSFLTGSHSPKAQIIQRGLGSQRTPTGPEGLFAATSANTPLAPTC